MALVVASSASQLVIITSWDPGTIIIVRGNSFNLAATMPTGVPTGGVFSLAPSSPPLPTGATLSAAGMISAGPSAVAGSTSGLLFLYTIA